MHNASHLFWDETAFKIYAINHCIYRWKQRWLLSLILIYLASYSFPSFVLPFSLFFQVHEPVRRTMLARMKSSLLEGCRRCSTTSHWSIEMCFHEKEWVGVRSQRFISKEFMFSHHSMYHKEHACDLYYVIVTRCANIYNFNVRCWHFRLFTFVACAPFIL